jgi:hypothetical protein
MVMNNKIKIVEKNIFLNYEFYQHWVNFLMLCFNKFNLEK